MMITDATCNPAGSGGRLNEWKGSAERPVYNRLEMRGNTIESCILTREEYLKNK